MARDRCTCIQSTMKWGQCDPGTGCRLWREPGEPIPRCPRDGKECSHSRPQGLCGNEYSDMLKEASDGDLDIHVLVSRRLAELARGDADLRIW